MSASLRARLLLAALLLPALAAFAQAPAPAAPARLALVIGNAAYAASPLPNAGHDASDMARELEAAGFTVILRRDASLKEMHLALREFGDRLGKTSTGLFYFAGHGLQVRGRNYLLPVDADIAREDEVAFAALDLAAVMEKLDSARNPVNLVILDACRDNPFGTRLQPSARGLAQVDAPPGTLIAFSTAPGSLSADGRGRNGLYTGHLLARMREPGMPIEDVLKAVRAAVRRDSANRQVPWESTSLESSFVFRAAPRVEAKAKPAGAKGGASRGLPRVASIAAPPVLAAGDRWTYRLVNLLDGSASTRTMTVKRIAGNDVEWTDGAVSDLLGNFIRNKAGGGWQTFDPSSHMYVFPLRQGAAYDLAFVQQKAGHTYDAKVRVVVGAEEDIETPAGKFRAVRLEREVVWESRDKREAGVSRWTYWYNAGAKRWVAAESSNTQRSGKVTLRERWELESFALR